MRNMPSALYPEIIEVIERADQGYANAYRCGASDGQNYYVKSLGTTWRGLACEWVAARLAQTFGLPVAPFTLVSIDDDFAQFLRTSGNVHLVAGLAFGSRAILKACEFEITLIPNCKPVFRRDLVAFDWWIRNADRTLGHYSGNPNLL
jgi:hypothetical protein